MNIRVTGLFALIFVLFSAKAQRPYFQQHVAYTIEVKLDDTKHELTGQETIVYTNNSPDALSFIWFHIWPNAYKDHSTALAKQLLENGGTAFYYSKPIDRGYMDGLSFTVDNQPVKTEAHPQHIDIIKVVLNTPLQPGGKITIATPFHVKIPLGKFSRLGHIDQQYQISQWYPKPAVYDKTGWHEMPYLDQGEFYSEFGSFDVSITVPKNYVLMATGDLPDGDPEIEWWNKLAEQTLTKDFNAKKVVTTKKGSSEVPAFDDGFPVSDTEWKTLRFRQNNVHDFAWFCDKRYNVLKGQVTLPQSKRVVNTWLLFTNGQHKLWKNAVPYINDAIYYYSLWNGDYPYNHATAVDGALSAGGGMEYPNITVIGGTGNAFTLETVIMHEVGHNWFYGILGSNERDFGWMDEGLNSFNENRYIETKYPNAKLTGEFGDSKWARVLGLDKALHKEQYYLSYSINGRRRLDQPLSEHSARYTSLNYAGIVYSKTAIIFDYLMAYLGTEMMDKCMKTYYETWKFRHPSPADCRAILEEVSGKNLSWLFEDLMQTTKHLDYKITSVRKKGDGYEVTVKNSGEIAGPVGISIIKEGSGAEIKWYDGFAPGESKTFTFTGEGSAFRIDPLLDMPEMNRNNNISKTSGLCRKIEPLRLQLIGGLDDPERTQLFFSPVIGANMYNGFMLGGVFYNNLLPEKNFEYILMPLFGFKSKTLAGSYELNLNLHPKKLLQTVRLTHGGKRYAYDFDKDYPFTPHFNKLSNELYLEFRKRESRGLFTHHLRYRNTWIFKDQFKANRAFQPVIYTPRLDTTMFNDISFWTSNEHTIHAWNAGVNLEQGKNYMKFSFEMNLAYKFKKKKNELLVRIYAGTFIGTSSNAVKYPFHLDGITGTQDYLFESTFIGRSETTGLFSQQFSEKNGSFKVPVSIGTSTEWITTMNIKSPIPFIPFIKVFTDIGYVPTEGFQYDAGVYVTMFNKALEIYYPIIYSDDIKNNLEALDMKGAQLLRFSLNLDVLNPFKTIRNFNL